MQLQAKPRSFRLMYFAGILAITGLSALHLGLNSGDLDDAFRHARSYLSRFFPPDFSTVHYYSKFLIETFSMALWGTALAFVLSLGSTLLGARNFALLPAGNIVMRGVMNVSRIVPDIVLAIIFVSAFGPGPLAGVVTIMIGGFGQLGKMWNDALERLDPLLIEGASAAGARRFQLLRFCGWPGVSREVWGFTLFSFDRALREAAIIGIMGAGGIGMELNLSLRLFDYTRASIGIIMIVTLILATDVASSAIRNRLS